MNSIYQNNFKNQKVLIRVDFNVPLNNEKVVTDNSRIVAARKTIVKILNDGGTPILMSHLGRPKGEINPKMSLYPVVSCLETLLDREILFSDDCISKKAIELSNKIKVGEIHLLENLRFYPEESLNETKFRNTKKNSI